MVRTGGRMVGQQRTKVTRGLGCACPLLVPKLYTFLAGNVQFQMLEGNGHSGLHGIHLLTYL